MTPELQFLPPTASTLAADVDALYFFFLGVCGFFGALVFFLTGFFAIRYRRKAGRYHAVHSEKTLFVEIGWAFPPLLVVMTLFVWGAQLFVRMYTPPEDAMEIFVTGKQWMWKIQHPNGRREINELHVPTGQRIVLTMTSEDVIHSFYVPGFRVKRDVLPGRYTQMWFEATRTGELHLFCAEYCGTEHSLMVGRVVVMTPSDYQDWLMGGGGEVTSMAARGQELFQRLACNTCHHDQPGALGPDLAGLLGRERRLITGETIIADPAYVRESILRPQAKQLAGYPPVMPPFQGQIGEEGIMQIIAYIRSLGEAEGGGAGAGGGEGGGGAGAGSR